MDEARSFSQPCGISSEPPGPSATRPLLPPTTLCHYPAGLRPPALDLEPGRFQVAYGARHRLAGRIVGIGARAPRGQRIQR